LKEGFAFFDGMLDVIEGGIVDGVGEIVDSF